MLYRGREYFAFVGTVVFTSIMDPLVLGRSFTSFDEARIAVSRYSIAFSQLFANSKKGGYLPRDHCFYGAFKYS